MLEDSIGKAHLQKTLKVIQDSALELENYKSMALQQRKDELRKLSNIVWDIVNIKYKLSLSNKDLSLKSIQDETLNLVSTLQYANDDYFYISDYNNVLIAHPYLKDKDFTNIKDVHDNPIVPALVNIARTEEEGFIKYWWKKNNNDPTPYEKLTYAKNFAPWKWVIGTGVYIDDIEKELTLRKKTLISRLKSILRSTKIGPSGYVYIFDSLGNMIIHPNKDLEGKNFKKWLNPGKNTFIFDDLVHAYKYANKTLYYNWDTPDDKKNYSYKKISWIEYDPYFDWYICSSDYIDEFYKDSNNLKKFVIYTTLLIILLLLSIGLFFLRKILTPIVKLSEHAKEVIDGNLHARYNGTIQNDETGLLAIQFNQMLDTIHEQINTLDNKVQEKTEKLTIALKEKELLLKEVNHRVKNNLYVINSIIGLQAFQKKETSPEDFIQTIQHRIQSMALGHEMLSKSGNTYSLKAQEYIPTLVQSLIQAYIKDPSTCNCVYKIVPVQLDIDKLLSCGLIINELITNAIKYAFTPVSNQLIISLKQDKKMLELNIKDNGPGFDSSQAKGIGLELVDMLVHQLEGTIDFNNKNGSRITIRFHI
jgi:two-component sensor histidine kinase